jgi:hypothetical protein
MFDVGKQVVCIADTKGKWPDASGNAFYPGPVKDQILTIRDIKDYKPKQDVLGLQFFEVGARTSSGDAYYNAAYFRPVKDTNIDCIKELLLVKT